MTGKFDKRILEIQILGGQVLANQYDRMSEQGTLWILIQREIYENGYGTGTSCMNGNKLESTL